MTATRQLTQRHRAQQMLLGKATRDDVKKLWPLLDWARLDATYPDLAAQMAVLVRRNRQTSNGLASAYLRNFAIASGIKVRPTIVMADPMSADQLNASLQTTTLAALKDSSKRGVDPMLAMLNGLTQTQGSMSRLVLNAGRQTVARTSTTTRNFVGWQRVGVGDCDFCRMLLGRGAVYSEESADFAAHDHCACSAEPVTA